ncbi:MAG: C2 domain-containing protein [Deltaproteobacteria bacterium]|nr:C2 domain-containing protein [Deltaproteobacteria bacterium]
MRFLSGACLGLLALSALASVSGCGEPMILSDVTPRDVTAVDRAAPPQDAMEPEDSAVFEDTSPPLIDVPVAPEASVESDAATAADSAPPPQDACVPSCSGRACGPDGCGGTCGTCGGGSVCNSAGMCVLGGPTSGMWIMTAVQGDVSMLNGSGGQWDSGINMTFRLPDPKVCITVGTGREECSPFIANTIAPSWNHRFMTGINTTELMGGQLRVRLLDDDTAFDDTICALAPVRLTAAQVTAMRFEFRCTLGGAEFTIATR